MASAGWSLPRSRILRFPPRCTQPGSDLPTSKTPRRGGPSHLSSLSTDGIGSIPFPQTSVPAAYHGEGPGLSLSHLIASLHPDRPPPPAARKQQRSRGCRYSLGRALGAASWGGTATVCRALPTQASPALSPSDHSNSQRWLRHTQKPKADPSCHPCPPASAEYRAALRAASVITRC